MNRGKVAFWISRIVLGGVFIFAAIGKIINPTEFAEDIDNYRFLPYMFVVLLSIALPWIELLCGILLLWGKWLKGSSFILIVLNIVFIIAISSAMIRGLNIDCGCFSLAGPAKAGISRLLEDIVFLAMAIIVFRKIIHLK